MALLEEKNIIDAISIPFNVLKQAVYINDKCKKKNPPKLTYRQDLVNDSCLFYAGTIITS